MYGLAAGTDLVAYETTTAVAQNKEVDFWVWARNPCRKTTLTVDTNIYNNAVFIYFIYDTEKSESFDATVTAIM